MTKLIAYWSFFALTMAIYVAMVMWSLPVVSAATGGLIPFDMRPSGYSFEDAVAFLTALSPEGRAFYLNTQLRIDTAYPAMMAVVLSVGGLWLARGRAHILGLIIVIASVGGAIADYIENWAIGGLLKLDVAELDIAAVQFANTATVTKSGLTTVAMVLILLLLVFAGVKKVMRKLKT